MKIRNKKEKIKRCSRCLFLLAVIFVFFATCKDFMDADGETSITINLGSDGKSAIPWPPDGDVYILNQIEFKITLTGNGQTINKTAKGGNSFSVSVSPGYWNIELTAYYQNELYATGSDSVDVIKGQKSQVTIIMKKAFEDKFTVTMQNDGNGTAAAIPNIALKDETVTISAMPNNGFVFKEWQVVSGGAALSGTTVNPAVFNMPANDVTIRAVFMAFPISVTGNVRPYNGSVQTAEIVYTGGGGAVTVIDGMNIPEAGDIYITYRDAANAIVTPTTAGTYGIYITTTGGTDYPAITDVSVGTLTINPKALIITGASHTKTYNGTTAATGVIITLSGIELVDTGNVSADTVTAAYTNANAGTTSINITAVTLTGSASDNYTVTLPAGTVTVTGITKATGANVGTPTVASSTPNSITVNAVNLSSATGQSIEYAYNQTGAADAATLAALTWTVYATPTVTFSGLTANQTYYVYARSVSNTNYETGAANVSAGIITQNLLSNTITFTTSSVTKVYGDASFTHTFTNAGSGTGATTYTSSDLAVATVTNAGVVTILKAGSTTITVTKATDGTYGTGTANYSLTVNPKSVTITGVTASNKVYDGGTSAAPVTAGASITGNIDGANLTIFPGTGTFADKNVGNGKTVSFSGFSLGGSASDNYTLSAQPANTTANITALAVTITGVTASNKTYNGNTTATPVTTSASITGNVDGANLTIDPGIGTFADKNVGTGKIVTFTGFGLGGSVADNYTLSAQPASTTANITAKSITITGVTATSRAYIAGNTSVALTGGTLQGVETGDTVSVDATTMTGTIAAADAGTGKAVTTNIGLTGADAGNYSLTQPAGITVTINQATGETPAAPTAATVTPTSVTLSTVTVTTGQDIEYARNTGTTAPTTGWQATTTFDGLTPSTNYYFFARAVGNTNITTATSTGTLVTTKGPVMVTESGSADVDYYSNLKAAWDEIKTEAGNYTVTLYTNQSIAGAGSATVIYEMATSNVKITLVGDSSPKTISLTSPGRMFSIGASGQTGIELTLENNITLVGQSTSTTNYTIVRVWEGASFTMKGNSKIMTNNGASYFDGGGVYVIGAGSNFTMQDDTSVSGTFSPGGGDGGGVYINNGAAFVMRDNASVFNCRADSNAGGVYIGNGSTFTMQGNASIYGNNAKFGGGVVIGDSTFTLEGGTIYGSDASSDLANTATGLSSSIADALLVAGTSTVKYGNGLDILPHTDGYSDKTDLTISYP